MSAIISSAHSVSGFDMTVEVCDTHSWKNLLGEGTPGELLLSLLMQVLLPY